MESWRKLSSLTSETQGAGIAPFFTISRQFGCGAFPLAEALAEKLLRQDNSQIPWAVYDQALVQKIADDHKLKKDLVESLSSKLRTEIEESVLGLLKHFVPELKVFRSLVSTIRVLAAHGWVILVGRGSAILTGDMPGGFHLRLIAPLEWRVEKTCENLKMTGKEAREHVIKMDTEREAFIKKYLNSNVENTENYNLIANCAKMTPSQIVEAVAGAMVQ